MTEPMTLLQTPGDLDKAPVGSIVCKRTVPYETLVVGIDTHETLVEALPLRVLRWGRFQYPTGFDDVALPTLADMTTEEREKCVLMQAQDAGGKLCIILYASPSGASVLYRDGAIGKTLETFEDFQNTPVGTVAIDADGDLMCKKDECSWAITDELAVVNTDEVHRWYTRPAKIIAVAGEQK